MSFKRDEAKNDAVAALLAQTSWRRRSLRALAKECGCSSGLVARVRRELGLQRPSYVIGVNGVRYHLGVRGKRAMKDDPRQLSLYDVEVVARRVVHEMLTSVPAPKSTQLALVR